MARQVRHVKRQTLSGRQALVRQYSSRKWYELADWAKEWVVGYAGWAVLLLAIILAPVALVGLVLGAHALPLEFLGIPATNNSVGLPALIFLVEFALVVLAVRPLFRHRHRGWHLLITAAAVHLADSIFLQHAITGALELLLVVYLYIQVRRRCE